MTRWWGVRNDVGAWVLDPLREAGTVDVIPSRQSQQEQRADDVGRYKARYLIENFFCRLKRYRAIATRDDKTRRNSLAAVHLVATVITLN